MSSCPTELSERNQDCWYREVCMLDNPCRLCNRYTVMKFLMENSNLPKSKQKAISLKVPKGDEEAYDRLSEIKYDIKNFVESGKSLYIGGVVTGTGKSSWAIKLMHQYFNEIWETNGLRERALFISVPNFLMQLKDFDNKDPNLIRIKRLLKEVDLVVWDDIASTTMTAYDYGQLLPFIDYRSLAELSNIYTANCDNIDTLVRALGEKIASRIWSHNTEKVIFKSTVDFR